jgi:hypothetical protein
LILLACVAVRAVIPAHAPAEDHGNTEPHERPPQDEDQNEGHDRLLPHGSLNADSSTCSPDALASQVSGVLANVKR